MNDITGELRDWAMAHRGHELFDIADRIDARHVRAMNVATSNERDEGWIRLPVDVDGVPINVGDMVEESLPDGGYSDPFAVDRVELSRNAAGESVWSVAVDRECCYCVDPSLLRHHAPTVEDVLRECCKKYHGLMVESMSDTSHDMPAPSEIVAEYAAKLRLAEGVDA